MSPCVVRDPSLVDGKVSTDLIRETHETLGVSG